MIIYEKNNKLNVSFENDIENPDFEIGKDEVNFGSANIVSGGNSGYTVNKTRVLDGVMMTFEKQEASSSSILLGGGQYEIGASTETTEEIYNLFSDMLDQPAYTVMIDGSPVDDLGVSVENNSGYTLGVYTRQFGDAVIEYDHYIGSHVVDIDLLSVTVSPEFMLAVKMSTGKGSTPNGGK